MNTELRVLRYFLAVAHRENISHAAAELSISQPALSRQLMDLEDELGVKLLKRAKRRTTLTEAGYLLKKRAEEISTLVEKTIDELSNMKNEVSGSIRIGCGETMGMRVVAEAVQNIREHYPKVYCHLYSTDDSGVKERLEKGTLDFGVLVQPEPPTNYDYVEINHRDTWGVFMRKDSHLADLAEISAENLYDLPLIVSRQSFDNKELGNWFGKDESELNIVATYTLIYNASLLAEAGVGYLISLDRLINLTPDSDLVFRPLTPATVCRIFFVWKRGQVFSHAAALLQSEIIKLSNEHDT